jgi:hypothetical protein
MDQRVGGPEREREPSISETATLELDAMTWGAERALKAMVEYQVETLRFLARRSYCNLEYMRQLRHCAGPQDLARLQQSWLKECVADYGEEAGRLLATGFQLSTSDVVPLQSLMYRSRRGATARNGGTA